MNPATDTPKAKPKTRVVFCLVGLLVLAAVGAWELIVNPTFVRQQLRLRQAEQQVAALEPELARDPAFAKVRCHVYTGLGGAVSISGQIADEATFNRLQNVVSKSHSPVAVMIQLIRFDGQDEFQATIQPLLRGD